MRKRIVLFLLSLQLLITFQPVFATSGTDVVSVEYLPDGSYFETTIDEEMVNSVLGIATRSSTITRSKTKTYKNSSGTTLWYVKVTGTYTYGSGSAKCTKSTVYAATTSSAWKIASKSSSKSGATAIAKATGKKYVDGTVVDTRNVTVKLTCRSNGTVY